MQKLSSVEKERFTIPDFHSSLFVSCTMRVSVRQEARERIAEGSMSPCCDLYTFSKMSKQSLHFRRFTLSDTSGRTSCSK